MTVDALATVEPDYRHVAKRSRAGAPIAAHGARPKWHELARDGVPPPASVAAAAHVVVIEDSAPAKLQPSELGFAILLVRVWRGANELWEAVDHCQGDSAAFTLFADTYPATGLQRPTFCVWELGIVSADAAAWSAYLRSHCTEEDACRYLETQLDGAA